jgi:hypothetical protein
MRKYFGCLLGVALGVSACTTKSSAKRQADAAFQAGQQQAQQAQQGAVVYFRGFVRKPAVPWAEDLTLAKALLQAEYTGMWDPRLITITRKGETFRINPKRLLSGQEDPVLEPGDIVEVQR